MCIVMIRSTEPELDVELRILQSLLSRFRRDCDTLPIGGSYGRDGESS